MPVRFALTTAALAAGITAALAIPGADAAKRYLHPKYKNMQIQTIGMLQWMERKQDVDAERIMRLELAQAVANTGYTFTNPSAFRTLARSVGAESLLVSCMDQYRSSGEIQAETIRELGSRVSVDAILAPFLDRWEQEQIPLTVRGNSRTEIGTRLALYSAKTGELLWAEYIDEMGEGPYNDPGTGQAIGSNPLSNRAGSATGLEAPSYEEIADKWSRKVAKQFPPPPKPSKDAKKSKEPKAADAKGSDS
jgi:hypothetical protein